MNEQRKPRRRRHQVLRDVAREIDRRGHGLLPWNDELATAFVDEEDLLVALHARWHRILAVRIDPLLERGASGEEFIDAWQVLARETPGQRRVFERGAKAATVRFRRVSDHQDAALAFAAGLVPESAGRKRAAEVWRAAVSARRTTPQRSALRTLRERVLGRCPYRARRLAA